MSSAEYQRKWRAAHGAKTGKLGRPITEPCGTLAAYRRHLNRGETACDACRKANTESVANQRLHQTTSKSHSAYR